VLAPEIATCELVAVFVGRKLTKWHVQEANTAFGRAQETKFVFICLPGHSKLPDAIQFLHGRPRLAATALTGAEAVRIAGEIVPLAGVPWRFGDDLLLNPHLFEYEKDAI